MCLNILCMNRSNPSALKKYDKLNLKGCQTRVYWICWKTKFLKTKNSRASGRVFLPRAHCKSFSLDFFSGCFTIFIWVFTYLALKCFFYQAICHLFRRNILRRCEKFVPKPRESSLCGLLLWLLLSCQLNLGEEVYILYLVSVLSGPTNTPMPMAYLSLNVNFKQFGHKLLI